MTKEKLTIFWFRRDLRLDDNHGLYESLKGEYPVLPLFIFDTDITNSLPVDDSRVNFIYSLINDLSDSLKHYSSSILVKKGNPLEVWNELIKEFDIQAVYANEDYEPYGIKRDQEVKQWLSDKGIPMFLYKDQVVFAKDEVLKDDMSPYTVFTAYKNKWLKVLAETTVPDYYLKEIEDFAVCQYEIPDFKLLGFEPSGIKVKPYNIDDLQDYHETRDFPAKGATSNLGPYLRFGGLSIRKVFMATRHLDVFLSELIWREFFMQILYHFPSSANNNFRSKYDNVQWRNKSDEFKKWKNGETGYLLVDAGMRELNTTGYIHNRVRMVVAGFLCKHLLIDWKWGERYFAEKLLDFELSSNVGNWQWAAGTGCDAAPYFRVFNPMQQVKKFDPKMEYIKKWLSEKEIDNAQPMVDHKYARERAIYTYKASL